MRRAGSAAAASVPVDVALICATHRDLRELIAEQAFREDLYYRINGLCRDAAARCGERTNILQLVARHLLEQQAAGEMACELDERAAQLLLSHPWPGNLRQLSHVVASAVALVGDRAHHRTGALPGRFHRAGAGSEQPRRDSHATRHPSLSRSARPRAELIERTMRACHGNVSAAARALKVSRSTLYNKLKRG